VPSWNSEQVCGWARSPRELTLERLSTLYKLKLSTDGFGHVIASAPDGLAAEDEPAP